jgi:hypothetical protein
MSSLNPFLGILSRSSALIAHLPQVESGHTKPVGRAAVDLGISTLVPWGHRGTARRLLGGSTVAARRQLEPAAHQSIDTPLSEARSVAIAVSILTSSLTEAGNSTTVLRRLGSSLDSGSPRARALKLERALQGLCARPVIPNAEIPAFLDRRHRATAATRLRTREPLLAEEIDRLELGPPS